MSKFGGGKGSLVNTTEPTVLTLNPLVIGTTETHKTVKLRGSFSFGSGTLSIPKVGFEYKIGTVSVVTAIVDSPDEATFELTLTYPLAVSLDYEACVWAVTEEQVESKFGGGKGTLV